MWGAGEGGEKERERERERERGGGVGLNAPAMERRDQACLGYLHTTSNHLSPSTVPVGHHPLPPFLKAAGLQTVKVQSDSDHGPPAWQLTGHYALTIQNCDLIK